MRAAFERATGLVDRSAAEADDHAGSLGTTATILGRRHICCLTPVGVTRSAAGPIPACPAERLTSIETVLDVE